ncbi:hypothetical protein BC30090_p306 (plasmid) [Bacillus cereus]|uniref:hypothetical protein n=1 Tax=Bacillus TaxID=1386 RepID=UPI001EE5E655|nr:MULTISPECIES: hypothetical protein [Bacillus]BCD26882.1 hypothetical protein BC30090_p306 [Bacillus cereus]GMB79158.1 hypothetical protein BCER1_55590 [Bacillus cereus]
MDFERIPILLKRYDFREKMNVCQAHSKELMSISGLISIDEWRGKALPWDLETFALFSVITLGEYSDRRFDDIKGKKQFAKIINAIKDYRPPKLEMAQDNNRFLDYFMIVTGLNQFQIQEDIGIKIYRYSYIFNFENKNLNMKQQFTEKFGCSYDEFKRFGFIIHSLFSREINKSITPDIYDYVIRRYSYVIQHLLIDRADYVSLQEKIIHDTTQYIYGFKYFYQFPFISYNQEIFLPLPHLIIQSVTSSLLFRLTEGNNKLRDLFGKEVLESYILHICGLSEWFDEVIAEYSYKYKRNNKRTLDIMIRKGDKCLMLDSKSMSPRVSLRDLNEQDIEHTVNRMVTAVIQVYEQITERFRNEYYPFDVKVDFLKENIFGAVILNEDSYILREIIMNTAAEKLKIVHGSEEYKYLCSNVKLMRLYEFEKMIFQQEDVLQLLINNRQNESKWFDFSFENYHEENDKGVIEEISQVSENMKEILMEFVQELVKEGLISR